MTAQHKWRLDIACPGCEARGKVLVLEDSGPPFGETPRREFQVGEPFEMLGGQMRCRRCGLPVKVAI